MATVSETVRIIFSGIDETGEAVKSVKSGILGVTDAAGGAGAALGNFTGDLLKVQAAAIGTGAAFATFAASVANDFELAFREIATLIDEPVEALDGFRQGILEYAQDSSQSLETINNAVYAAISAGTEYTDSLGLLARAEELAVAGNADLADSTVALASTLNAYGESVEQAERYSDIFFTTVKLGQTTLPELNSSLANVTGIAAAAGVSFEEVAAAIATLTASGTQTAQAITQVRAVIAALLKPSSEAATIAKELGLQFDAQRIASIGLEGVIKEVTEATGGNQEQMARLFGSVEALNAALVLGGTGAEKFTESLAAMENSTGATSEAADKFDGVLGSLSNSLQVFLVQLGTPLRESFVKARAALGDIVDALTEAFQNEDSLGRFTQLLKEFAETIATNLTLVAQNLPAALDQADWTGFENGVNAVIDALDELFTAIFGNANLTTTEGLIQFIERMGSVAENLGEYTAGALGPIQTFLGFLVDLGSEASGSADGLARFIGELGGWALIIDNVLPSLNSVLLAIIAFGPTKAAVSGAVAGLGAVSAGLGTLATAALKISDLKTATVFAGMAAAAGTLGYETGKLVTQNETFRLGLNDLIDRFTGLDQAAQDAISTTTQQQIQAETLRKETEKLTAAYREYGDRAEDTGQKIDFLTDRYKETGQIVNVTADELDGVLESLNRQADGMDRVVDVTDDYVRILDASGNVIGTYSAEALKLSEQLQTLAGQTDEAAEANKFLAGTYTDAEGQIKNYYTSVAAFASEAAAETDKQTESAEKFRLKMLEIASDERIALIEAKASINVAEIEADARKVEAAFESIGTTIQSTGDLLGDLFGGLNDANLATRDFIEDAIKLEQERRQAALELQARLTEAQINNLNERSESLRRGDALINVEANNLQEPLELIWREILREIQIKATAEGLEQLLGVT